VFRLFDLDHAAGRLLARRLARRSDGFRAAFGATIPARLWRSAARLADRRLHIIFKPIENNLYAS
jgi:hypothetical protein